MSFNSAAVNDLFNAVVTDALTTGVFETVNTHEPKSAPGNGLRCSVWVDDIRPVRSSGLDQTSCLVTFYIRVYNSMLQEPQDNIDPAILSAICTLMDSYTGDFQLSADSTAEIREIDLLGQFGDGLSAQAGYLDIDNKKYRVMVLSLPVVIDNMFVQES